MKRAEFIEVEPNVNLHITDYGQGKPVVLIHGWPLSDEMFEYQYKELVNNGFRAIGITLRGYGKSDKPYGSYSYDQHAADIKKVLEILGLEDVSLVGFSMGGAICVHYMSVYDGARIEKLILAGAAAPIWTKRDNYPYGHSINEVNNLIELCNKNRPMLLEEFSKIFASEEDSLPEGIENWLYDINLSASGYATEQGLIALRDSDLRPALEKIEVPTAIIHGKNDKVCPFDLAEQMHKGIKDSELIPCEKSGHALFYEQREDFNEELIKFIKKEVAVHA